MTILRTIFGRARKATVAAAPVLALGIVAGLTAGGDGLTELELGAAFSAASATWYAVWRTPNTERPADPYAWQ